ncbi:MAG: hypothetical protein KGS45_00265 [Planctomycetes bacterium]|nr:hypothetical protein [Planctomycetota bacterium]
MMSLTSLWLPILLSTVFCFIASSIIWMASPLHKKDYENPGEHEGSMLDLLRRAGFTPGVYVFPWCTHGKPTPEMLEKMKTGPWAHMTVMQGPPSMAKPLILWFVYLLAIGITVGYVGAASGLGAGVNYLRVFQIVGVSAFLVHVMGSLPMYIWMGQPWKTLPGRIVDGLIYTGLTAGTFGWLWPKATLINPAG